MANCIFPLLVTKNDYFSDPPITSKNEEIIFRCFSITAIAISCIIAYTISGHSLPNIVIMDKIKLSLTITLIVTILLSAFIYTIYELKIERKNDITTNINNFYNYGTKVTGIYIDIFENKHHIQKFYDDNQNEYLVYCKIPYSIFHSIHPLLCNAYIYDNKALIYEIYDEMDNSRYSDNKKE